MLRLAAVCEYDGTDFVGWQAQANGRSVQTVLSEAVTAVADQAVLVHGAGRTDAGVHAARQVAHFDTTASRTTRQWLLGINSNLPDDVAVHWVGAVPAGFDARRSALWRQYRYRIVSQPTPAVRMRHQAWWLRDSLDCGAMTAAASAWLGDHDFSAFRAAHCQSQSPKRCMHRISVVHTDRGVDLLFRANAFLYHMVRNLVGTLVAIGRGEAEPGWGQVLLEGRDRTLAAATAPARGLTLDSVAYDAAWGVPR
jgi:tRNA pseudouridine38-40 synthase